MDSFSPLIRITLIRGDAMILLKGASALTESWAFSEKEAASSIRSVRKCFMAYILTKTPPPSDRLRRSQKKTSEPESPDVSVLLQFLNSLNTGHRGIRTF